MDDARRRRSGCASPGAGEIRPVRLPRPGPGEVLVRTLLSGVSRGTETLVFRGGCRPASTPRCARRSRTATCPAPVKYGYLSVGVVEEGPASRDRADGVLPLPAPDAYVVPVDAVVAGAGRGAARARRARRHRRDRGQRAVGRGPAASATGSTVVGAGMVGCCVAAAAGPVPRRRGARSSTSTRPVPAVATALGVRLRRAGRRDRRPRPGRARQRHRPRGCSCSLDLLAPDGDGARAELVRRRRDDACRSAARSTPAGSTIRTSQVGTVAASRRGRRTTRERLALAAGPAARPGVRRPAHRRVPVRRAADGAAAARGRETCRRCATS